MIFKGFRFQITFRLAILTAMGYGLLYYTFVDINYIRVFFLGLFSLLILVSLFYFLNKTHKLTSNFLDSILNNDFTIKYPTENQSKTLSDLYEKFNEVNDRFSQNVQEQANQYQYLLTLINQLKIAVVAFDARERVHVVNQSFQDLVKEQEVIKLSSVKNVSYELYEQIRSLKVNEQVVIKVIIDNQIHQYSMASSIFRLRQKEYQLVSLQDIHTELDQNEMQAWQKLIRVLTHEIMNSVSPITSLSGSLENVVKSISTSNFLAFQGTLIEGIDAIKVRSQGLMNFTQAYRKLTRLPNPVLQSVEVSPFLRQIETLIKPTLNEANVEFGISVLNNTTVLIDPDLMQQVLINLLKNAIEAFNGDQRQIDIIFEVTQKGNSQFTISDNGPGIPDEIREQVFIPFYTTKVEGSGIGLSLAKQIVQLHGGTLSFNTSNKGTSFYIKL